MDEIKFNTDSWREFNINIFFDIEYGNKFDRNKMAEVDDKEIAFISRSASYNGVSTWVDYVEGVEPYAAGCLTVALGGSLGSTFLQPKPFYTAQNVAVLIPKIEYKSELTTEILLFIATLIKMECKLRFIAFGRELNTHIKRDFTICLPSTVDWKVDWKELERITLDCLKNGLRVSSTTNRIHNFSDITSWKPFRIKDLFKKADRGKGLPRGKVHSKDDLLDGDEYFYVGAKKNGNGVMYPCGYNEEQISKGNCIVFICNGQGSVGYSNYMDVDFMASGDVALGYNDRLNKYNALFIVTMLDKERFKYSFGRKWGRYLLNTEILLPSSDGKNPDWDYMERYIKSLPFGDKI